MTSNQSGRDTGSSLELRFPNNSGISLLGKTLKHQMIKFLKF